MRFLPRQLISRTIMLVSIILLATGVLSGWISAHRQSERLIASMREHSSVMVRHFAENCARILILQDFAELEAFLLKTAELPEVMHLQVFEPDGTVVGEISRGSDGKLISSSAMRKVSLPSDQDPSVEVAGNRMEFLYPIRAGNLLGWIRADFSLAGIRQEQLNTWVQDLFLSLLWVVFSASLILLMLRPTADALRKLAIFARELHEHKGDTIHVNHEAIEIEALEESLNHASLQLLSTEQQLNSDRERLAQSEENYRRLLDTIQEGIWVIDRNAITTFVNPRMAEILGYLPDEMIGRHLFDFMDDQGKTVAEVNIERRKQGVKEQHDFEFIRKDGRRIHARLETGPIVSAAGEYDGSIAAVADITEKRIMELELQAHLRYFESMDRINRAIQGAISTDQMMGDALDVVLATFACDRAFLLYPCDPDAASWTSPMERTRPEYPGVRELNLEMPMTAEVADTFRILLASDGPATFGPGTPHPLPEEIADRFGFKCFMSMAIYPKVGSPWQFGIHQCSHARIWTEEEERLFREIGRRLGDALTILLTYRNLQEREAELRRLNERLDQRVQDRTTELEAKNTELERLNRIFVGRELRMIELKERIRELEEAQEASP